MPQSLLISDPSLGKLALQSYCLRLWGLYIYPHEMQAGPSLCTSWESVTTMPLTQCVSTWSIMLGAQWCPWNSSGLALANTILSRHVVMSIVSVNSHVRFELARKLGCLSPRPAPPPSHTKHVCLKVSTKTPCPGRGCPIPTV